MASKHPYTSLVIRLLLFAATVAWLTCLMMRKADWWLDLLLVIALLVQVAAFLRFYDAQNRKLAFFLEAVRNEDTALVFPETTPNKSLRRLHASLNELNRTLANIRIKNENNDRFFRELIEQSSTGLLSYDEDGYVEMINSAAKKYLEVIHVANIQLLKQKTPVLYKAMTETGNGGKKMVKTMLNGELVSLSVQVSDLRFSEKKYRMVSIQDIRHEIEENEVESWQKLIRVMTHEIMNSIAPITSLTQTLLVFFTVKGQPKAPEAIDMTAINNTIEGLTVIEDRGKGLIHFVENYRKLTKIPHPSFSAVDPVVWVQKLALLFQPELNNKQIRFEQQVDALIKGFITDEKLLTQVMINLINNAIDAFDEQGTNQQPTITLSIHQTPTGRILLELADNGCGIDPSLLDSIFIPFFTTKEGGNGIGLSLSRQIVKKLGGQLSVKSTLGKGSHFIITCSTI